MRELRLVEVLTPGVTLLGTSAIEVLTLVLVIPAGSQSLKHMKVEKSRK